jgi:hypothetical protein
MAQPPPAWIDTRVDVVVGYMEAHSLTGPVGLRYREEDAIGELVAYLPQWNSWAEQTTEQWSSQASPWICGRWWPSLIG